MPGVRVPPRPPRSEPLSAAVACGSANERSNDGEPYNLNDSYYPLELAQGTEITQPTDIARGASEVLTEQGHRQVRALDEIYIRMPTPDEVRRLDLGPGTPVACHIATGFTAQDQPVRVVLNVLPGDRHVIVYERARPMRRTLTITQAEQHDLPAAAGLRAEAAGWLASKGLRHWQPGQPRAWSPGRHLDAIERGACYLAYDGDELVGTITLDDYADPEFWTPAERSEPALYIHRMIIAREHSGQDLGRVLLDFAEERATQLGARRLRLDAWKDNEGLHAYYRRQGFQHVRTVDLPHRGSGALFQRALGRS